MWLTIEASQTAITVEGIVGALETDFEVPRYERETDTAEYLDKLERMKRMVDPPSEDEPGWFIPGINKAGCSAPTILEAIEKANETEADEEAQWAKKA